MDRRLAPALLLLLLTVVCVPVASARAAAAGVTLSPLPSSDYAVRAMCSAPAPRHAACLALQLVPQTAEARARTHPLGIARARRRTPTAAPSPAAGSFGLRPQDLHSAYQLPTTAVTAQTIALVDAYNDPYAESDLKAYDEEFDLPECTAANGCFKQVNQNGATGDPPFPTTASELEAARKGSRSRRAEAEEATGWGLEISLDIETAHATCQSCTIILVEANSPTYENLETAERSAASLGAGEISNSWAGTEEGETPELESKSPFDHPGLVIAAAAGDWGYLNWDAGSGERGYVSFPASSPHVVAVGGTRLTLGAHNEWSSEAVWNGDGATGGGCSSVFAAQPWQQSLSNWSAVGCSSKRAVADVAADADPYTGLAVRDTSPECQYVYREAKTRHVLHWCTIGGTSLATPLIASVFALAGGADEVSYPTQTLYENEHKSPASLHDVTAGSNGECTKPFTETGLSGCTVAEEATSCDSRSICVAGTGYDGPTGVGTPDGIAAFETSSQSSPPPVPTVVTSAASGVSQTAATLAGTVNPNGSEVSTCKLEYGQTSAYGSSVTCAPAPGSGKDAVAVSAAVSGLTANTTYHFRVAATNAGGTSYGSDESFKTQAPPQATPPEFGRCVQVGPGAGKYSSATCTTLGGAADYEWQPGVSNPAFTTTDTSSTVVLQPQTGAKVICAAETSAGDYTGSNTVGDVILTLTGCERAGSTCASGALSGEIVSSPLAGVLGIDTLGATASKDKIGLDLHAAGAGPILSFSCGLTPISVTGSAIVPVRANLMTSTQTLKFKATKGEQKPQSFVEGPDDVLSASVDDAPPTPIGLTMTSTLTSAEPIEINSVV